MRRAVLVAVVVGSVAGWLAWQLRPRLPYVLGSGR